MRREESLPPEKVHELKQLIRSQLSELDLPGQLREIIEESAHEDVSSLGEKNLLKKLKQKGVIDNLMKKIRFDGQNQTRPLQFVPEDNAHLHSKTAIDPNRRYVYFYIKGGRAFLEHLQDEEFLPGNVTSHFQFHIHFRDQRFKSRLIPCACEPDVSEGFLLELHKSSSGAASKMIDTTGMLSIGDPIHIVLIKHDPCGDTSIVSSHFLEWRPVLTERNNKMKLSLELHGVGAESDVAAGILDCLLEVYPRTDQSIGTDVLRTQLQMEKSRRAERERLFLVYVKQWWREFLQIRDSHSDRLVKIFAMDENSRNRPVCSYLKPMRGGRLFDTPRQAARFVSLLHHERPQSVGGGQTKEMWSSTHALVCKNKGSSEDHSLLLCSLLLGFGLNAYVCVGTKHKSDTYAWVVVINLDGLVTFWESITGHRHIHTPIDPNEPPMSKQRRKDCPYRTIGCVFNDKSFYANCQPTDSVELCRFDLHDQSLWKTMSTDAIQSVCSSPWPATPPLCPSSIDHVLVSNDLEIQLRHLIAEHRKDNGLTTMFDDQLSYLLTPALASYEHERVTGIVTVNEEFKEAIQKAVPDDHTFKGHPFQVKHRNARKIFTACLRETVGEQIINCRGDHVRHALRVRVYTYPEQTCATWVTFACQYKSVL